jgi:hypothetical protein
MIISIVTNGFGNNLFQCIAGKLLATFHNTSHFFTCDKKYYGINHLKNIGFNYVDSSKIALNDFVQINDNNFENAFNKNYSNLNFVLSGYFENKNYYEKNQTLIRSWFPRIENRNNKDLVFHFRTGDRLFYKNEFNSKPTAEKIKLAIDSFHFDNLHVVTDMYDWRLHTTKTISQLKFHVSVPSEKSVSKEKAVEYFNSCYNMLNDYKPVIEKRNVCEDFNFIRSFNNILFQHGTMSWWASFLSQASRVGVYGPWRPWKGKSNKNLSNVEIEGWFKWQ